MGGCIFLSGAPRRLLLQSVHSSEMLPDWLGLPHVRHHIAFEPLRLACGRWHTGGWHAGGWHLDQAIEQNQTDDEPADIVEAPSAEQESNPEPAKEGWDNDTSLHSALQQWGASFCRVHHVGYFCNRYTRVRCCRTSWGYSMRGTTLHSNRCGWHVGGWHAGGWHAGG